MNLCFYHDDTDGIMSAAIVKMTYPNCEFIKINYKYDKDKLAKKYFSHNIKYEHIIIVDFSFGSEVTNLIGRHCRRLIWIDHHKTAKERMPAEWHSKEIDGLRRLDRAGCYLTWEYFHPDTKVPNLVQYIDDWDRWQFKHPETREIHEAFYLHNESPLDLPADWHNYYYPDKLYAEGIILLAAKKQRVKKNFDMGFTLDWHNYKCRMMNTNHDISDTGNYAVTEGYDIGIIYYIEHPNISVSLRSQKEIDVSEIAEQYGGGGHKNAAGFTLKREEFFKIFKWKK